jgi:hypothetical protein
MIFAVLWLTLINMNVPARSDLWQQKLMFPALLPAFERHGRRLVDRPRSCAALGVSAVRRDQRLVNAKTAAGVRSDCAPKAKM